MMKFFLFGVLLLTVCAAHDSPAQSRSPDDVYSIGKTSFAYYQSENKTEVASKGIAVFDNSRSAFNTFTGHSTSIYI
jgi:hypothetical protein